MKARFREKFSNACIKISLEYLSAKIDNLNNKIEMSIDHANLDMYLQNQQTK